MKQLDSSSPIHPEPLDVLLINPGGLSAIYQSLANEFSAVETPSLAALFVTHLRQQDLRVDILDAAAFGISPQQTADYVCSHYRPSLVVMIVYGHQPSASTQTMPAAGLVCREIKKRNSETKVLMTGTHPAALPEQTLNEEAVDFVCSGEGPQTILGVIRKLLNKDTNYGDVPGLCYRLNEEVVKTEPAPLLNQLDSMMPEPALDLLPMERYRAHNWHCFEDVNNRQPYASIHTTLGCPYRCSFCCINAPFGHSSYRMWSPETVIKQIDILVNGYGVRNIKIVDEMFVLNKRHVLGVCDGIIERGYDLNIWAYARVDTVKDEFLDKLKSAGVRWLALGIESGSKHVRDGVEKGRFGTEDILTVVNKIKTAGINIIGNYIFGLPDDDQVSMQETLDLAIEANCEFANFYSAMAYPGSPLYRAAIENGWELPESWIGYSQHAFETLPLRTEFISAAEVLKFRDQAFRKYFTNPRYLSMVREKFGIEVEDHIGRMLEVNLRRKILVAPVNKITA